MNIKSKKFISLATIFTLASTLLVGCGTSKPSNQVLNVYNVGDYIDEDFRNAAYDNGDKHSVPYLWGTFGIVYNKNVVDEEDVKSWDVLWNKKYAGEIQMLDSVRDSMGISLKRLGYSMNSTNPKEIEEAKEQLMAQKPIVQSYVNDDGKDRLVAGESAMGIVYSGDAITLIESNDDLAYSVPKEGTNRWIDAMCIPKTAENKDYAEKFINFMLDPENAAVNVEYIWYSTPNTGAIDILGEDYTDDPIMNPSQEVIDKSEVFSDLDANTLRLYDNAWIEVKCE